MTSSLPDTPEGATTRLALAAAEAAHALDHGWPHPPTSDELADLYRSDEDAARTLRSQRQPVAEPPPRLAVKPWARLGGLEDLSLPRLSISTDGDGTNARVFVSLRLATRYSDPAAEVGLDLTIPPRLFWLLDLVEDRP